MLLVKLGAFPLNSRGSRFLRVYCRAQRQICLFYEWIKNHAEALSFIWNTTFTNDIIQNYMVADKQGLKKELVDALCFFNMTSAVVHKVVLIPDYLHSTFHIFFFPMSYERYLLICTSNSRICYLSSIVLELLSAQNIKFIRFLRPKKNYVISTKKWL